MLVKTDVKISLNKKATRQCTVYIKDFNFFNSYWQFFGINVWMSKCNAASLTLELKCITNVTIEKCIFGVWTFSQVQYVFARNSRSSAEKDFPTSLNFDNSSGLMENITVRGLNYTNMYEGLWVQNNSYIQITKSTFENNTVTYGVIKVLDSSTLDMSDCNLENNQAIDYAGAIFTNRSFIYLTNTSFNDNEAIHAGGALYLMEGSFLYSKKCTFSNNQVKFGGNSEPVIDSGGGAICLFNSTANLINGYFYGNKANYGGGVYFDYQSKVKSHNTYFRHNSAVFGSAISGYTSSTFSCTNCSMYQNEIVGSSNSTNGAAVNLLSHYYRGKSSWFCNVL